MAGSIIGGLLAAGVSPARLAASDPEPGNLERMRGLGLTRLSTDNAEVAGNADVVVLAVKPQLLQEVCESLAPVMGRGQLAISIAAGVGADSLQSWLGDGTAVVRCMPNTPALLGAGASALYAHGAVSEEQRHQAQQTLEAVGRVRWVEEELLLHAVTAVSGSGPAYFFLFMEAMIAEGERMGLDAQSARTLCAQTCVGAGRMLLEGEADAGELCRRVCSPGGTTERAVEAFRAADLEAIVGEAMRACVRRSEEMARELS